MDLLDLWDLLNSSLIVVIVGGIIAYILKESYQKDKDVQSTRESLIELFFEVYNRFHYFFTSFYEFKKIVFDKDLEIDSQTQIKGRKECAISFVQFLASYQELYAKIDIYITPSLDSSKKAIIEKCFHLRSDMVDFYNEFIENESRAEYRKPSNELESKFGEKMPKIREIITNETIIITKKKPNRIFKRLIR